MNTSIEAVIFDFNGTLFNDSKFHNEAWSQFAALHNRSLSPENFDDHIHGSTNKEIIEYLFERNMEKSELYLFYEEKENIYRNICKDNPEDCTLTPGANEYLNYLVKLDIPRTIATASYLPNVELFFELFNLNKWFPLDQVIYDSGLYRGKPHPDMFLAAAELINIPIRKCLIIEDSISGIKAAENAGAGKIVAVDFDGNPRKFAQFDCIDSIVSDFRQLIFPR
jgi:beta-phosphoglucomutase-like phosphatase (HAD superfamily)